MILRILTREVWRAASDPASERVLGPARYVHTGCTDTRPCRERRTARDQDFPVTATLDCGALLRTLQERQINLMNLTDIRYNFLISSNGTVFEGRGWMMVPSLPSSQRKGAKYSCYIGFIGTYTAQTLPKEMTKACRDLIQLGITNQFIARDFLFYDIYDYNLTPY